MRRTIIVLIFLLLFASTAMAGQVKTVADVTIPNTDTLLYLSTFDVGFEDTDIRDQVRIVAFRETIDELIAAGFEVEIQIEDLDKWVKARNKWLEQHPQEKVQGDVTLDHYLTHAEMTTFLSDLATAHSDIMSMETIGYSVQNRELYLIKISDNVETNEAEPAIFFEFNIHGDEIAAYTMMLHMIELLVTQYGTDPTITNLVNTREIFIEPLTNPDGNQTTPYGRSRYNANGVDMNRNWGFMWNPDEWNPGSGLQSEPEVQAVSDVWMGSQPFEIGVGGHSGAVLFLWAWGYHGDVPYENAEADYLGEQYCYPNYCEDPEMNEYAQTSHGLYYCWGTSMDEMYGSHGMIGTTLELTYEKQCTFATSMQVAEWHEPSLIWLFQEMGNGLHGTVTDDSDGAPVMAVIEVANKWYTFTDYEVGDFHKYLRPGTYNVHIWANGYDDYDTSITIAEGVPYNLDVEMTPSAESTTFLTRTLLIQSPNDSDTHTQSKDALGRPDGDFVSLGYNGWAVFDLGPDGIDDGAGDDLAVYEGNSDAAEDFLVYGSDNWRGPWTLIGDGLGSTAFDLNDAGLDNVRYVKIVDGAKADPSEAGQYDGFDLDAIGTPIFAASFGATPVSGGRPLTVDFIDTTMGNPTTWAWDFGDGGTSTEQNPTHEYTTLGDFTVSLTVTGPEGSDTLVKTDFINVYEEAPVADLSGTPTTGSAPLDVTFTSTGSGIIDTYLWNFGDNQTSTEEQPTHTYQNVGNYTVRLTVHGPGGSDTVTKWLYIHVTEDTDDDSIDDDITDDDVIDDDVTDDDVTDDDQVDDDTDDDQVDDDAVDDDQNDDDVTDDDVTDDDAASSDDDDDDDGCGC